MDKLPSRIVQKYSYFRHPAGGNTSPDLCFPGYSLAMLANSRNRERFEYDSNLKLIINGGEVVFTVAITLMAGDHPTHKMIGRVAALASCTKGSFKDDGFVLETLPLGMGPANSDDRNIRFLIRRYDGKIPVHLDKCLRLIAGVFNYLTDSGVTCRESITPLRMQELLGVGLMHTSGLVRWFISDPMYNYITDVDCRIERKLFSFKKPTEVAKRIANALQGSRFEDLSSTFMALDIDQAADRVNIGTFTNEKKMTPKGDWKEAFDRLTAVLTQNNSIVYAHSHIAWLGTNWSGHADDYVIRFGLEFDPDHDDAADIKALYRFLNKRIDNHYLIYGRGGTEYLSEVYGELVINDEPMALAYANFIIANPGVTAGQRLAVESPIHGD